MKFEHNGLKFEVNVDHIVINSIRRIIKPAGMNGSKHPTPARVTKEKERGEKDTRVWYRLKFAKCIRWAKFSYSGTFPDVPEDLADAKQFSSPEEIQKVILDAMQRPDIHLWFSGSYCNIEICENWQEVKKIQVQEENRKRRSRAAKILKSPNLETVLIDAIRKSAATVKYETINTAFGPVPVMMIQGSGKHARM